MSFLLTAYSVICQFLQPIWPNCVLKWSRLVFGLMCVQPPSRSLLSQIFAYSHFFALSFWEKELKHCFTSVVYLVEENVLANYKFLPQKRHTVKLVICGHSTVHHVVSMVDKVSTYERLQLFTQFIIYQFCHLFKCFLTCFFVTYGILFECVVHTFLLDLCPPCVQIEVIWDLVYQNWHDILRSNS